MSVYSTAIAALLVINGGMSTRPHQHVPTPNTATSSAFGMLSTFAASPGEAVPTPPADAPRSEFPIKAHKHDKINDYHFNMTTFAVH